MTPSDLAVLHRLAFPLDRSWSAVEFAELLAQRGMILCGDDRAFILGRVTFDEAEVLTLATAPAQRRLGLGRAVLARFSRSAARAGAAAIFLEVAADNAPAIALYDADGFRVVGRRPGYYMRGPGTAADALVMRRAVTPADTAFLPGD